MGTLFVVRHGQTTHNASGIVQGPRIDSDLSEAGRRQAMRLADALKDLDSLFVSPLRRARDTAQAIVDQGEGRLALQVAPEMYEVDYGALAGRSVEEVRMELEQVFDAWRMGFVDASFPGGESAIVALQRIRPMMERLRSTQGRAAVVAHGRINRILLASLTGAGLSNLDRFPQDNGSITELRVDEDGIQVVRLNDTTHLAGDRSSDPSVTGV